jgi:hypothetical protein
MRRQAILVFVALALLLLMADAAGAMQSTNHRLDWFTPMTGGGGGPASSANYVVNFTVGQSVVGASSSLHYGIGLGYWYGAWPILRLFLPLILR